MFRANALYEGAYLLGTSIARPLIAKRQIEIAARGRRRRGRPRRHRQGQRPGALRALAITRWQPDIKVIAPWREWDLTSRTRLLEYRRAAPDPDRHATSAARRRSRSTPTCCTSRPRARCSRTRGSSPRSIVYQPHRRARKPAPDKAAICRDRVRARRPGRGRRRGAVAGGAADPAQRARRQARHRPARSRREPLRRHEDRAASTRRRAARSCMAAHRGIESLTLDRGAAHLKDELMPRYAELIYNGFWFAPEREMLQALIDKSQEKVDGHGAAQALQGQRARSSAANRRRASTARPTSPSRRTRRLRPARRRGLHQAQRAAAAAPEARAGLATSRTLDRAPAGPGFRCQPQETPHDPHHDSQHRRSADQGVSRRDRRRGDHRRQHLPRHVRGRDRHRRRPFRGL